MLRVLPLLLLVIEVVNSPHLHVLHLVSEWQGQLVCFAFVDVLKTDMYIYVYIYIAKVEIGTNFKIR